MASCMRAQRVLALRSVGVDCHGPSMNLRYARGRVRWVHNEDQPHVLGKLGGQFTEVGEGSSLMDNVLSACTTNSPLIRDPWPHDPGVGRLWRFAKGGPVLVQSCCAHVAGHEQLLHGCSHQRQLHRHVDVIGGGWCSRSVFGVKQIRVGHLRGGAHEPHGVRHGGPRGARREGVLSKAPPGGPA